MNEFFINSNTLNLDDIEKILFTETRLALSDESKELIQKCRDYLDKAIEDSDTPLYGITTGFGSLYNQREINFLYCRKILSNHMLVVQATKCLRRLSESPCS